LLYDLNEQRRTALQRVSESIAEMNRVKQSMSADSPQAYLVDGLLRSLHRTKEKLEHGLRYSRRASRTASRSE